MRLSLIAFFLIVPACVLAQVNSNLYSQQYLKPQYVRLGMTYSAVDVSNLTAKGLLSNKLRLGSLYTITNLRRQSPVNLGVGSSISVQPKNYHRGGSVEGTYPGSMTLEGYYSFPKGIRTEVLANGNFNGRDANNDLLADLPLSGQVLASVNWMPYRYGRKGFVNNINLEYLGDHAEHRLASGGSTLFSDHEDHLLLMARMLSGHKQWNWNAGGAWGNRSVLRATGDARFMEFSAFSNLDYRISRSYGNWMFRLNPTFNGLQYFEGAVEGVGQSSENHVRVAGQVGLDLILSGRSHVYTDVGATVTNTQIRPIATVGFSWKDKQSYGEKLWLKAESKLVNKPFNVLGEYSYLLESSRSMLPGQNYLEEWKWSNDFVAIYSPTGRMEFTAWGRYEHYFDYITADFANLDVLNPLVLNDLGLVTASFEAKQHKEDFYWSVNYRYQKVTTGQSVPYLPEHAIWARIGGDVLHKKYRHSLKPILECGLLSSAMTYLGGESVESSSTQALVNFKLDYTHKNRFTLSLGVRNLLGEQQGPVLWTSGESFEAANPLGVAQGRSFVVGLSYWFY